MGEIDANAYAVTGANAAAGASNSVETQQPGGSGALRQTMVIGDPSTRANMATVGANGQMYMQGYQPAATTFAGITATGAQTSTTATGYNIATVTLRTFTGTTPSVTFSLQASDDNTNWVTIQGINNTTGLVGTSFTQGAALSAGTAGPSIDYTIGAYSNVRINVTAISGTSATAAFGLALQSMPYEASPGAVAQGVAASGSAVSGNPVLIGGSDGTNAQAINTLAGDTNFTSQIVSSGVKTINFTTSVTGAQTLLANTDLRGYAWMEINYTSVGPGLALTGQFATSSGGAYITPTLTWTTSASAVAGALGVAVSTTYYSPVRGNFFQLAVSAMTSGTTTGTLTLRATPPPPPIQLVSASGNFTSIGNKTNNNAVPGATNIGALVGLANAAVQSWTEGDQVLVSTDLSGNVRVTQNPTTVGGLTISRTLAAATTNATSVKGSAGQVYGWSIFNTAAATKFVKLYNKATAPTVGTDTPVMTIPIPAGGGSNISLDSGIAFATGIALAITGVVTDADTTAVALNDIVCNLLYK